VFRGDRAVSRRHAVLRVVDGNCVVEDHNSTNGTFVNDVPIDRPTVLGPEDELRIGSTRLRLAPAPAGTALLDAVPATAEDGPWEGTAGGDLPRCPRSCG
jgi:pSer/pThr/pTyr-binding forkhead associated (FHA) protein